MAQFKYQAKNKAGETYERSVEAAERSALGRLMRGEGGSVVGIHEAQSIFPALTFSFGRIFNRVKTQEKITVAKNLGKMIEAGLPVVRALTVMSKQSKNKALQTLLTGLETDVKAGATLSEKAKCFLSAHGFYGQGRRRVGDCRHLAFYRRESNGEVSPARAQGQGRLDLPSSNHCSHDYLGNSSLDLYGANAYRYFRRNWSRITSFY